MTTTSTSEHAGWNLEHSYSQLPEALFTREKPLPVRFAALTMLNDPLAADLGLDADVLRHGGAAVFVGNQLPPGADPIAQAYAGHQFGHFTTLGDGRALLLGEQLTPAGLRFDIQLKGSGRTRYSRGGDGRAVLGPMLREYIISEGMHALGIPTTRSLAVAATGESVLRDRPLPGAVLTRVAASHIRVGSFQYAAALGSPDLLADLLDYTIARHAPDLQQAEEPALAFLEEVVERQASLIARWMLVGFVHGVMNTDNMTVSGETIDYGPCAFLDVYHPDTVFSSIDHGGRYAYSQQPTIAQWNLARLAESLLPLVRGKQEQAIEKLVAILSTFPERYGRHYLAGARTKLGLTTQDANDADLYDALLAVLQETEADFTATFVSLADQVKAQPNSSASPLGPAFVPWLTRWRERLAREPGGPDEASRQMHTANPVIIPRNLQVEEALTAAEAGDLAPTLQLLEVISKPFCKTAANEAYRNGAPAGSPAYCTFCGT